MRISRLVSWTVAAALVQFAVNACPTPEGAKDSERAMCAYNDALNKHDGGRFREAKAAYREAGALWAKAGPSFDAHRATALMQIGGLDQISSEWADAAVVMEEALELFRKSLGPQHERFAAAAIRLAGSYTMMGRTRDAQKLFDAALAPGSGISESDRGIALNTLGADATLRGDYSTGIELLRRAAKHLAAEGDNDPAYASMLCNLAAAYILAGDTARAEPLLKKSRAIYTATLGADHPRIASLIHQEGALALRDGKKGEAERLLRQAYEIASRVMQKGSNELATYGSTLGLAYMQNGKLELADPLLSGALDARRSTYLEPHRELALAAHHLAHLRVLQHRDREAGELFSEAVDLYEKAMGRGHEELRAALDEYSRFARSRRDRALSNSLAERIRSAQSFR